MPKIQSITDDTAHTILSDPQRRHLLRLLKKVGNGTVDELALQIAAREQGNEGEYWEKVSEDAHKRVTISLVHKHIPLLADHNIIEYNSKTNEVVLMDVVTELEPYLGDQKQDDNTSTLKKIIPGY